MNPHTLPPAFVPSALVLLAALLTSSIPQALAAQEPSAAEVRERATWLPDTTAFAPLLAAPRETSLRGGFLFADRTPNDRARSGSDGPEPQLAQGDFEGRNLEAEVALGHRIPILLLRREDGSGPSMILEFEVGTFSRFFMAAPERDLINIDYQVGIPLTAGWRAWEGRVQIRHLSSHMGDDFGRRFGLGAAQVSREGVELLVARRFGGLRAYAGGEANAHANPGVERTAARVGLELDSGRRTRAPDPRPYWAVDFRVNSAAERLEGAAVAGLAFRVRDAGLRLEGRGHFGPSAMGWLRRSDETYWGLGLRVEL